MVNWGVLKVLEGPVEAKVKAAAVASPTASVIAYVIMGLIPGVSQFWAYTTALVATGAAAFLSGYLARHTPRSVSTSK